MASEANALGAIRVIAERSDELLVQKRDVANLLRTCKTAYQASKTTEDDEPLLAWCARRGRLRDVWDRVVSRRSKKMSASLAKEISRMPIDLGDPARIGVFLISDIIEILGGSGHDVAADILKIRCQF
jgi:hypothetical protein